MMACFLPSTAFYDRHSGVMMSIRNVLRTFFGNAAKSVQLQAEIREGVANEADLINRLLKELINLQVGQAARQEQLLREVVAGIANQTDVLNERLKELVEQRGGAGGRK
jgi:hypothetical protein